MFLRILSLIFGGSSFPWVVGAIFAIVVAFFAWLNIHDRKVEEQLTQNYNAKQEQVVEQKQEEFQKDTTALDTDANKIADQAQADNKKVEDNNKVIEQTVQAEDTGTKQASPYLKDIVKQLNKNYGN